MTPLPSSPAFAPSRVVFTAVALMLAVLGFAVASAVNASPAAASMSFQAQAKKKCKMVKPATANRRCVKTTAARLRAAAIARRDRGKVGVMTRNLYLGADLGPAISAPTLQAFINANGEIMRDVDTNNYPVRVRGLVVHIDSG